MSAFDSIFDKNKQLDPNLSELFSRKATNSLVPEKDDSKIETDTDSEAEEPSSNTAAKLKKLSPELEKRTIFVGNLSQTSKKEELIKIFKKYGKIEAVRFRNVVPEDLSKPKKYAFITKQQHPNKHTINGFVRFADEESAKNAAKETNGMEYKQLHLRVDIASQSKVHDNKKSIFLGGLPFDISDEDVYKHFASCGPIDYVRIIRDNKTGIGKGFGYVQFKKTDTIALALKLNDTVLNQRKIRVSRCANKEKILQSQQGRSQTGKGKNSEIDKISDVRTKPKAHGDRPAASDGSYKNITPAKISKKRDADGKKLRHRNKHTNNTVANKLKI